MRLFTLSIALTVVGAAQAQTWSVEGRTLASYANNEAEFQGPNSNPVGGASIPYTSGQPDHKSLPQRVNTVEPPMLPQQPPWISKFTPLSNYDLSLPFGITNYMVAPQKKVVIYVTWTEEKGSETWRNDQSERRTHVRDWSEPASSRIVDMGINDPLNEFHDRAI